MSTGKLYRNLVMLAIGMTFISTLAYTFEPSKEEGKPDSHRAGWNAGHQQAAKSDPSSCESCHKAYFCVDCHQRRDTITQRVHRRNFLFYHSLEARANPRKCDECHRINYCTDCHKSL